MSFLFGPRPSQPNRLGSIQVQTSEYGTAIPYAAGTVKLPIKLIDYVDFQAKGQSAGKGGGLTSYEYFAAIDAALCIGPYSGVGNVFSAAGASSMQLSTETYTIPSGGGTYTSYWNTTENDEGVSSQQAFSFTADDFGSDGMQTISGTQYIPLQKVGSSPAAGQYSVTQDNNVTGTNQGVITGSGGNLHYTFSAADAGKTVTIHYTYTTNTTNYVSPAAQYNFAFAPGTPQGTVWGYMEANHPERALSYPNIARVLASNFDLGSAAAPPNVSLELLNVRGLAFGSGIADCDPARVLRDICTDPVAGMAWPYLADLGDLSASPSSYSNFCVANNLFISPSYDSTQKALATIGEITSLTNAAPVWSGGLLKIIPFGDTTAVGNGRTFTPATQPVATITLGDLVVKPGQEPILTSWKGLSDNYNSLQFQYTQRSDNYNTAVINAQDEAAILMNGPLPMQTITGDMFRVTEYAAVAANMLLKRNSVALRNYAFTLKWWHFRLEPMDIVLLGTMGNRPVRIVSISEADDYTLSVTAEDFLYGVGSGTSYAQQPTSGTGGSGVAQPGDTALAAAFQPVSRITGGSSQLWLALTGGANWGGCEVFLSTDGASYSSIGKQEGSARAGTVTVPFPAAADPDTSDTLSVAITGQLTAATQAAADAFATLSLVGTELIAYEAATLASAANGLNDYNLGTYIRRGVFSTGSQPHPAGERFVRLDDQIFKYTLDPSLLGKTIWLKFVSFNLLGAQPQDIATVAAHEIGLTQTPYATTMTVTATNNGAADTIQVYNGTPGQGGTATLDSGATISLPAESFTNEPRATWYGLNWNPVAKAYVLYTDQNAWLADQYQFIGIGSVVTP